MACSWHGPSKCRRRTETNHRTALFFLELYFCEFSARADVLAFFYGAVPFPSLNSSLDRLEKARGYLYISGKCWPVLACHVSIPYRLVPRMCARSVSSQKAMVYTTLVREHMGTTSPFVPSRRYPMVGGVHSRAVYMALT
jgi:hypothetical protein